MANNGKNIQKFSINSEELIQAIRAAGYSIRSIAPFTDCSERTLRSYLKRNEMPVTLLSRLYRALAERMPEKQQEESIVKYRFKITAFLYTEEEVTGTDLISIGNMSLSEALDILRMHIASNERKCYLADADNLWGDAIFGVCANDESWAAYIEED